MFLETKRKIKSINNAAGPQKTLYVPKSCLKIGENDIIIFDSDGAKSLTAEFVSVPEL